MVGRFVSFLKRGMKIRTGLFVGFIFSFLGVALFVAISYLYFIEIEEKLKFVERADDALNLILEMRRYEKNYLLYHQDTSFQKSLRFLNEFENILIGNRQGIVKIAGINQWETLFGDSKRYRKSMEQLYDTISTAKDKSGKAFQKDIENTIRQSGQKIIAFSRGIVRSERTRIEGLFKNYQILFIIFFVTIIIGGAVIVYLLENKLLSPLSLVEEATQKIAKGGFRPISWKNFNDEIGSLVNALNRMVLEIQERQEQLIQAKKLSALGTLTSGVAHELNNPLSNISTSYQILLEEMNGKISEHHNELLKSVEGQIDKAKDIVRALLEFSREKEFELEAMDLKNLIEDTVRLVQGEMPPLVHLSVDVPDGMVLDLDKRRMQQALLNLFINGIQAMEQGGELTILAEQLENSDVIVLRVMDTGTGISSENMSKIFDPFFTTKDVGAGTGLGLSVTYGIIEQHGGKISVESEIGKGTTFTLEFPVRQDQERAYGESGEDPYRRG
jgi:signal transduction histidine kinase